MLALMTGKFATGSRGHHPDTPGQVPPRASGGPRKARGGADTRPRAVGIRTGAPHGLARAVPCAAPWLVVACCAHLLMHYDTMSNAVTTIGAVV